MQIDHHSNTQDGCPHVVKDLAPMWAQDGHHKMASRRGSWERPCLQGRAVVKNQASRIPHACTPSPFSLSHLHFTGVQNTKALLWSVLLRKRSARPCSTRGTVILLNKCHFHFASPSVRLSE
uniref:Uncharacterized protein n=1 Tax=Pipistrellus kuhlii TaxID=59472 RepID=A0A7J8B286_PIPKU|nr:hypothetical protein mPipKuh1_007818 [Pipistrellus kuhlii]